MRFFLEFFIIKVNFFLEGYLMIKLGFYIKLYSLGRRCRRVRGDGEY